MSYNTEKSNVKLEKKVYKSFTINLPDLVPVVKQDLKEPAHLRICISFVGQIGYGRAKLLLSRKM